MEREPQTARERAVLLLKATLLPGWQPTASQGLVWAIRGAIVLGVLVLIAAAVDRSLWAWLNLLIIPVVLAIGGYLFTRSENRRNREIADERRQDEMLQAYLDGMAQLLADKDRPLRRSQPGDTLSTIARARTFTVLPRLDGPRKGTVLEFLYVSGLITKDRVILELGGTDLSGAYLSGAYLGGAYLWGANLTRATMVQAKLRDAYLRKTDSRRANLHKAALSRADMRGAYLSFSDLSGAIMQDVNLSGAHLGGANLTGGDLRGARLIQTDLRKTNLSGARMSDADLREAWVSGANLSRADLYKAILQEADLRGADLRGANMRKATMVAADLSGARLYDPESSQSTTDLSGANLYYANLTGATVTDEQLEEADSLECATMPNGQKYEDWLKSRKGERE